MALFESSRAWSYTLFVSALLVHLSSATWDINNPEHRHGCQCPSLDPLEGCDRTPGRTLFVDGEGGKGFESVQAGKDFFFLFFPFLLCAVVSLLRSEM